MKIVLDTNVFVSGVFFNGPPYKILQSWRDKKFELVISPEIIEEYQRVGEILAEKPGNQFETDIGTYRSTCRCLLGATTI